MNISRIVCASFIAFAFTLTANGASVLGAGDGANSTQQFCAVKTKGTYGFQCQGSADMGSGLVPATFVGTVAGGDTGIFDGTGTFTYPGSSIKTHAIGQANFQDKTCFGHIQYQLFLILPSGTEVDLHLPLDIDFAVVDGGFEILGTPNSLGGVPGNAFMSCRLVKTRMD